ncbi:hypothetical protein L7F22_038404 [Adiantum nelumboides]|nr:hypothetical protein [Adiantum nelumboides]
MVKKNKLLSWLKLWHPSKKSTTDDALEGSLKSQNHLKHNSDGLRHSLVRYGRRGWILHWKLLHLEKRSCAQTRDVCTEGPYQNPKQGTNRAHLAQPIVEKLEPVAQRKNHVNLLAPQENLAKLRVNVKEGMGRVANGDLNVVGFDLQQHKFGLKNRVLPLTAQEDVGFSTAYKLKTTLFSVDEEHPISGVSKEMEPGTLTQKGSLSFKKPSFSRISSTPVSPRSPSETKWKMLLSCSSQWGSPKSPVCLHDSEWNSLNHDNVYRKGSLSTMGSPWNSHAGGNRYQTNRASSFKGSYKQGQWVTTDSDFVVLEL